MNKAFFILFFLLKRGEDNGNENKEVHMEWRWKEAGKKVICEL